MMSTLGNSMSPGSKLGSWEIFCFDYDLIQDIQIKEVQPNGYVKMVSSKEGDVVYYYYNKDGLLIKEQEEIRREAGRDYKGIYRVTFSERPVIFDKPTALWFQIEVNKLRTKNVEYIDVVMAQSESLQNLQKLSNEYLATISLSLIHI